MEMVSRVASSIRIGPMIALFYLIMGSVSFVLQTVLILSFLLYKAARREPGGLLFMISVCELARSITMLSTGMLFYLSDDTYCPSLSFARVFLASLSKVYNFAIGLYLAIQLRNTQLKRNTPSKWPFLAHFFSVLSSLSLTVVFHQRGMLGKNLDGTCSFLFVSLSETYNDTLLALFMFINITVMCYYRQFARKTSHLGEHKKKLMRLAYTYILCCTLVWLLENIVIDIMQQQCEHDWWDDH